MNEKGDKSGDGHTPENIIHFVKIPNLKKLGNISEEQIAIRGVMYTINANIRVFDLKISIDFAQHIQQECRRLKLNLRNVILMIVKLSAIWKIFAEYKSKDSADNFINKVLPMVLNRYSMQMHKREIVGAIKELKSGSQNIDGYMKFLDVALTKMYNFKSKANAAQPKDIAAKRQAKALMVELAHSKQVSKFSTINLSIFDPKVQLLIIRPGHDGLRKEKLNEVIRQFKKYLKNLAKNALRDTEDNEISADELNAVLIDTLAELEQKIEAAINSDNHKELARCMHKMQKLAYSSKAVCAHTRDINSVFKYANQILSLLKELKGDHEIMSASFIDETIKKIEEAFTPAKNAFLDIIRQALRSNDTEQISKQKEMLIYSTRQFAGYPHLDERAKELCWAIWRAQTILSAETNKLPEAPYTRFDLFK